MPPVPSLNSIIALLSALFRPLQHQPQQLANPARRVQVQAALVAQNRLSTARSTPASVATRYGESPDSRIARRSWSARSNGFVRFALMPQVCATIPMLSNGCAVIQHRAAANLGSRPRRVPYAVLPRSNTQRAACAQPEPVCARFSSPCAPLHEPGPRADKCPPRVHPPLRAYIVQDFESSRRANLLQRERSLLSR